jgi:hypothetical protein
LNQGANAMLPTNVERRLTNAESRTESLGMTQGRLKEELQIAKKILDESWRIRRPLLAELEAAIESGDRERIKKAEKAKAADDARLDEFIRRLDGPPKRAA